MGMRFSAWIRQTHRNQAALRKAAVPLPGIRHPQQSVGGAVPLLLRRHMPIWQQAFRCAGAAIAILSAASGPLRADPAGPVSGLPIPRFVSLKSDRVNLREGPSKDHRTIWIYERAGLPVEITAEFEIWRKIRDAEGTEGWVLHSLLSGRRTALVAPWKKGAEWILYRKASLDSRPAARLQSNVIASVKSCDGTWCHISGYGFDGFIQQTELWGVYPNETIE